ncbi:MAG: YafY family transcriptional regulator [Clostridia bacterium]|nr:YafY family transcriptional regulator [Clostridia bacterium]
MKFEIMMGILFDLLSKRFVKATYLAEKYQVSVRSIYRYLTCLELAGVPLYTTRGYNGGISIVDTYRFSTTFMTKSEFETTINTLSAIEQSVPNKVLSSAINKMKSTIKYDYFSGFDMKSGNLIIDAGPWGDTNGYKNKLSVLQKSIEECKKLEIKYHDRNGEITERIIEPYLIMFKQGLWYVYAFCNLRNDFRFFKTGRIEHANILNEKFTRKEISQEDLPLNFWDNSVTATNVEFEIDKSVISDVEEWLGVENVTKLNDKFVAHASLPFDDGLVSKIISYGSGLKVISPKELKDKIKEKAKEIANLYDNE